MSIQVGIILRTLSESSRVEIVFESLTSNKTHRGTYTLRNMNIGRQSNDSDTIVAWDVENKQWQDIRVSTITQFMGIPDGS